MQSKFFGVVEGFYRKPYSFEQRLDLISFLSRIGLNTYVYAPKTDPYHRQHWFTLYPRNMCRAFEKIVSQSSKFSIRFNYALSPMTTPRSQKIIRKIDSLMKLGIHDFSLLFDDIRVPIVQETAERQVAAANELFLFLEANLKKPTLFFCPTQYRGFETTEYIRTISETLNRNIQIFWTGKRVVSRKITEEDVDTITPIIKRPPLIWDNIFANDYIPGIILRFPYRYREPGILEKVAGVLVNPMNDYEKSKPLIYTAARFFQEPSTYVPQKAWKEAVAFLTE